MLVVFYILACVEHNQRKRDFKTMKTDKQILKELRKNDFLYEAIYCSIVADNDFIRELKQDIKSYKSDKYFSEELKQSIIENRSAQLKEYKNKRKQLKKACLLLFGDNMSDYND
jgi:hypothetical protein